MSMRKSGHHWVYDYTISLDKDAHNLLQETAKESAHLPESIIELYVLEGLYRRRRRLS